jgi:hypothetical protein
VGLMKEFQMTLINHEAAVKQAIKLALINYHEKKMEECDHNHELAETEGAKLYFEGLMKTHNQAVKDIEILIPTEH